MLYYTNNIRLLVLLFVAGILTTTVVAVGTASTSLRFTLFLDDNISGSGPAGPGSLAVASFYSISTSTGAGGFSGTIGGVQASGIFSLTVSSPTGAPVLPCASGEVSSGGTVVSGSFVGDQVIVASCIGSGVPGYFAMFNPKEYILTGTGTGNAGTTSRAIRNGIATAGVTSGLGSAGPGTLYAAEADVMTRDGTILGGGAFMGTISDHVAGSTWINKGASVQPGCTLTTSGTTTLLGDFPNQPVSNTYTPDFCPPPNSGLFRSHFGMLLGVDSVPIYKGTGSADSSIIELIGA